MFSEKRAITPVIATLLLIAITVAAVAGFYIFYNNFIRQQNVGAKEPSISISGPNAGSVGDVVTISIKNTGNVPFVTVGTTQGVTFTVTGTITGITSSTTIATLNPNQVVSMTGTLSTVDATTKTWQIKVKGNTASGSTVEDVLVINQI